MQQGMVKPRPARFRTLRLERDLWALGVIPTLALGSFLGLVGVYWDIAWHVDLGRDSFFSPPHLLVYSSMLSVLVMGLYGAVRDGRQSRYHLHLGPWSVHPGALVVAMGALVVLLAAPLDDLWHRLFGADVTLWGPMHLILLVGVLLGSIGGLICTAIERQLSSNKQRYELIALFFAATTLAWLVLVTAEYEFGFSLFLTVFHPILLVGLPSFALVLIAKLSPYRWSATMITLGFTLLRFIVAAWLMLTADWGMGGYVRPMIPILIFSALVVDVLVRKGSPGWLAGVAAGLVTLLVNAVWLQRLDITPWSLEIIMQALLPALVLAALAGGAGAWVATSLRPPNEQRTAQP